MPMVQKVPVTNPQRFTVFEPLLMPKFSGTLVSEVKLSENEKLVSCTLLVNSRISSPK